MSSVMVVASTGNVAAALHRALRDAGLVPHLVSPDEDLAAMVRRHPPDVAVVDQVPDQAAALAAVEWLRALTSDRRLPILVLGTGAERVHSTVDALRVQADDYLQRPMPAGQFITRICRYLRISPPALSDARALIPGSALRAPSGAPAPAPRTPFQTWPAEPAPAAPRARHPARVAPPEPPPPEPPAHTSNLPVASPATLPPLPPPQTSPLAYLPPPAPTPSQPGPAWSNWPTPATDGRVRMLLPPEGQAGEGGVAALWWACAQQAVTCRLDLRTPDGGPDRSVFVEAGRPVGMRSARPEDSLSEFLLQRGLLGPSQAVDARVYGGAARLLAARLVEEGVLKPRELPEVLRDHLMDRLMSLMDAPAVAWRCVPDVPSDAERLTAELDLPALVWRGIRRKFPEARLWALFGGAEALWVPTGQGAELARAGLADADTRAVALMDGTRTAGEVATMAGLPLERVLQLGLLLVCAGAARPHGTRINGSSAAGGPRDARAEARIDRTRVLELHRRCMQESYFSMLGLTASATPAEVSEALAQIRAQLPAAHASLPDLADLGPLLRDIQAVLSDAEHVLTHGERARRYRLALAPGH